MCIGVAVSCHTGSQKHVMLAELLQVRKLRPSLALTGCIHLLQGCLWPQTNPSVVFQNKTGMQQSTLSALSFQRAREWDSLNPAMGHCLQQQNKWEPNISYWKSKNPQIFRFYFAVPFWGEKHKKLLVCFEIPVLCEIPFFTTASSEIHQSITLPNKTHSRPLKMQ